MIKLKSKKTRMGIMLFLVPALVIYLVFQIIPIIGSIYFSLVDWNGIAGSAPKFVGLKNYIDAFHNADFILSLKNMARMVIISVICHTPIALLMAVAINTKCKGYRIFKALFFDCIPADCSWSDVVFHLHADRIFQLSAGSDRTQRSGDAMAGRSCNSDEYDRICQCLGRCWLLHGYYFSRSDDHPG